jgi:hypothetical protein
MLVRGERRSQVRSDLFCRLYWLLPGRYISKLHTLIGAAGDQAPPVREPCDRQDSRAMAFDSHQFLSGCCGPDLDGSIVIASRKKTAVRRERNSLRVPLVTHQRHRFPPGRQIPDLQTAVSRACQQAPAVRKERGRSENAGVVCDRRQFAACRPLSAASCSPVCKSHMVAAWSAPFTTTCR